MYCPVHYLDIKQENKYSLDKYLTFYIDGLLKQYILALEKGITGCSRFSISYCLIKTYLDRGQTAWLQHDPASHVLLVVDKTSTDRP